MPTKPRSALVRLKSYLRPYRLQVALALIALLVTTAAILSFGVGLKTLIDEGLRESDHTRLNEVLIVLFLGVVVLAVASYTRFLLVFTVIERMVGDMRRDMFSALTKQDFKYYDQHHSGDLLSRIAGDAVLVQTVLGSSVAVVIRNALICVGGVAMLLHTNPLLTGIVAIVLPLTVLPIVLIGRRVRIMARQSQARLGEVNAVAGEALSHIRTLKAISGEAYAKGQFSTALAQLRHASLARIQGKALLIALVIFLIFSGVLVVLWVGGHQMLSGDISAGQLSAFVFYAVLVAGAVGALSEVYADKQRLESALQRMWEVLDAIPAIHTPASPVPLPPLESARIVFQDVSFTYATREAHPALAHINLTIEPGETIAFVGHSGAGKTTLFQLLLRFYDVSSGTITIGGVPLHHLDPMELRQSIGVVPQDAHIFAGTIRDNITLGLAVDDAQLRTIAAAAQALEFIEALPQQFDTDVGESGVRLSGGERQRLAIARTLIHNPQLLLLDEATSALDADNERLVQRALGALMKGRTSLIIAHRLSTIRHAHRIVLMEAGHIQAIGTHDELLESNAIYRQFAQHQFGDAT